MLSALVKYVPPGCQLKRANVTLHTALLTLTLPVAVVYVSESSNVLQARLASHPDFV